MMNDIEKKATTMTRMSFREVARSNNWLVPCIRFRDVSVSEQIEKVKEEIAEVIEAYEQYAKSGRYEDMTALMMECADVQICMETLMDKLGAGDIDRSIARKRVFDKNNERDYYKAKKE